MSTMTALEAFDRTIHKTNAWLQDVMRRLDTDNRHEAYLALRATLHALRDRLPVEEAAHLGAQLPMLVRGFYYESWGPAGKPVKERRKEQFLARMGLERAIGVVYRPDTERQSHYFRASLGRQFDAVLHFDETQAVQPLERIARWEAGEVPETFPFAV